MQLVVWRTFAIAGAEGFVRCIALGGVDVTTTVTTNVNGCAALELLVASVTIWWGGISEGAGWFGPGWASSVLLARGLAWAATFALVGGGGCTGSIQHSWSTQCIRHHHA